LQCDSTHLTCPVAFLANHSVVVGWSTRPTSAAFRRGPPGPIHRVMVSPGLSAGGIRFLGHPVPAADLGRSSEDRSAYWPRGQTASGLPRSAPVEMRRGWVPPILRGLGAPACRRWHALTRRRVRSGSWPIHRRISHRLRRPFVTQPQRRFIYIHPSRLSLTRLAWMVQARLGLHPSALARLVTGALARVGNRHGHKSGPW
jgi:hypothetical protein